MDSQRFVAANFGRGKYHIYKTPASGPLCGIYLSIGSMPERARLVRKSVADAAGQSVCQNCRNLEEESR